MTEEDTTPLQLARAAARESYSHKTAKRVVEALDRVLEYYELGRKYAECVRQGEIAEEEVQELVEMVEKIENG